ncbi:PHP domain protein [Syntrophobotulus glycolicus DSM 8271]|uniref:protein-tyrosine-phosphatase n=1 Tax=Syntrophobotulus glycolicus (strain DSM 8271 / FlGlyR) TaxID=645991 RepID=F0SX21_SYNGF|nr:CpsB/CapC family capsule biosynthesis tyrosine phosphatase [Syntrophobotulus glycolicus]ADY55804.1 PHP domain protein [Syntrophobotulus glycolicus DSM 8271]
MIDYHSHILPCMDDGSRDTEESLQMLRLSAGQGVDTIIATPHFYLCKETVHSFLLRRRYAHELLEKACHNESGLPQIILGAETAYFSGISVNREIERLCIAGTRHLLLEMPFETWSGRILTEVCNLALSRRINPIIAHMERYIATENVKAFPVLLRNGVLMQLNADFLISRRTRKTALTYLTQNCASLLGSDSHNMTTRKPNMDKGYQYIRDMLGESRINELEALGRAILNSRKSQGPF